MAFEAFFNGTNIKEVNIAKTKFPNAKVMLEKDMQHLDRFVFIINE